VSDGPLAERDEPAPRTVIDDRAALARLEDLGDAHELARERAVASDPSAGPASGAARRVDDRRLLGANAIVAGGTLLSRLTGLARVAVFASVIGRGPLADAYLIGNETPNIVYELLIGGVLSATLVPLFTSFLDDDAESERATNAVITVTLACGGAPPASLATRRCAAWSACRRGRSATWSPTRWWWS
jgi:hypothetical protein